MISNNTGVGVSVDNATAEIGGDNRITNNGGSFGLIALHTSNLMISDGIINNNIGVGEHCVETSHCEWSGTTQINGNGGGGIEITEHSDASAAWLYSRLKKSLRGSWLAMLQRKDKGPART